MYSKYLTLLVGGFALAFAQLSPASAQDGGNKFMVDKIVGIVGGTPVYYSEVVERSGEIRQIWKEQNYTSGRDAMEEAFESLLKQKLLCNQAQIDSLPINMVWINNGVNEIVDSLIKEAGSIRALEESRGRAIYDIRQSYREKIMEYEYASFMERTVKAEVTITPGEVERFYKKLSHDELPIIPARYEYAHITKYPISLKQAQQRTRERLLELRERVMNGERFDMLARIYSIDTPTSYLGGEMPYTQLEYLVAPFAEALSKLQPGQVSEVVETEYGFHIIQLIDKKDNLYKSRHILMRPQFTNQELNETKMFVDSLVGEIRAGALTFEQAALKYSDDKYTRNNGGIMNNHEFMDLHFGFYADTERSTTQFTLEAITEMSPADYNTIKKLKEGDISDAFMSRDQLYNELYKTIKVVRIIPSHHADLNKDYLDIERLALAEKQNTHFKQWLDKKIETTYVSIDDMFKGMTFENPKWLK